MRLVSGIQPSGNLTLGNYLGAIKNFVKLQEELKDCEILVFIADLHAITVPIAKADLRQNIKSLAAIYLACGLDPKRVHIFIQSENPYHNQLGWIMECNSYLGELERMTQFKDKKAKQTAGVSAALLTYPPLMAADILLYDADLVPVGVDQKQHLELTRNLAQRFNAKYGDTFVVPNPYIPKSGEKIASLADPTKKMSKSDLDGKGCIYLLEDLNSIRKKIKSAVTDSYTDIVYDPQNRPGIANLLTIYHCLTGEAIKDLEKRYQNSSYATFKADLAEVVVAKLSDIQAKYKEIINSKMLDEILDNGRDYACYLAKKKIDKVYNRIGLGRKK